MFMVIKNKISFTIIVDTITIIRNKLGQCSKSKYFYLEYLGFRTVTTPKMIYKNN